MVLITCCGQGAKLRFGGLLLNIPLERANKVQSSHDDLDQRESSDCLEVGVIDKIETTANLS